MALPAAVSGKSNTLPSGRQLPQRSMHLTHSQMLCAMGCLPPEMDFAWLCQRHHDQIAPRVMFHLLFLLLSSQRLACPPTEGQNMYY